jgi:hypothetical protein
MVEWNSILSALIFGLIALGAYLVVVVKKGIEVAVKTTAEETAKATIQQLGGQRNSLRSFRRREALRDRNSVSKAMERCGKNFVPLRFMTRRSLIKK